MKKALLILVILSICISCKKDNTVDPKSDNYETVTIGAQVWMKKNIEVTHYRNGDPIPEVKDPKAWFTLTSGAWCYYNNDTSMGAIYGKLYNWYAVNDPRGLAPEGWHVPSDSEWTVLTTYLGESVAGGKMKETGTFHWEAPNWGATNESGFSALPGGHLFIYETGGDYKVGSFLNVGDEGNWWTSTEYGTTSAYFWYLSRDNDDVQWSYCFKGSGYSIRCIKD